jgi:hypothetical protein
MKLAHVAALALLVLVPAAASARPPATLPPATAQDLSPDPGSIEFLQARYWTNLLTLRVGDKAERDRRAIPDNRRFVQVSVCSIKDTLRIRSAHVQFENGKWQRLVVPSTLRQGECSRGIDLVSAPRRLRGVQFVYETASPGGHRGEILVRGRLAK